MTKLIIGLSLGLKNKVKHISMNVINLVIDYWSITLVKEQSKTNKYECNQFGH